MTNRSTITLMILALLLAGCATGAPRRASVDRAECAAYARPLEHSVRMKTACMIARGYLEEYSTVGGWMWVQSMAQLRQAVEQVAADLKGCNDTITTLGYEGRDQFAACLVPRGYSVEGGR